MRPQKGMSNTPLETSKHVYHLSMWLFIYVRYKLYIYFHIVYSKKKYHMEFKTAPSEVGERRKSETNIVLGGRKNKLKLTDRR